MSEQEIILGNKLIAEFDNWQQVPEGINEKYWKYHSSWDWIMPACHKWDNIYNIPEGSLSKKYSELCDELDDAVSNYEILPVWKQLVKCIQWYNLTKS